MTTKRAYADLERDGFIETVAGKGSFVTERNQDFLREELLRQVEGICKRRKIAKPLDFLVKNYKNYYL